MRPHLQVPSPQQLSNQFSQIARQLEPAVVNINSEMTIKNPHGRGGKQTPDDDGGDDNPCRTSSTASSVARVVRAVRVQMPGWAGRRRSCASASLGSGVIVDSKGYIVTNAHVVEKADRIRVKLMNDPATVTYDATVIGTDKETDLAVIKIDAKKPLPAAKMGNSDSMQVGDWVLAIGSPFGLEETVTAGIVSARGRNIVPQRQFQSFIQTDAAINPGNSGGPLVNMNGEVIGINTAIFTSGGGYQGVGFAMPSNTVVSVYNQLIGPDHKVSRGSIGVEFNAVPNPAVQRVYGVSSGVTIANVTPNGPAAKAGLLTGDTIVSVNGKTVASGDELVAEISAIKPGSTAKIGYVRNGKQSTADVTIADRQKLFATRLGGDDEGGEEAQAPGEQAWSERPRPHARDRRAHEAAQLQGRDGAGRESPAALATTSVVSRGDVILEINKQPVNSEADFRKVESS